jgi:uncharacterized protein (TIGR02246 family)
MRSISGILVLSFATTTSLGAQVSRSDSAAAVAVVEQFHAALAAADSARAVSLLADDVLIIEAGNIQTRADYLAGHLGADMKASQGSKGERSVVATRVSPASAYIVTKTLTPATGAQGNTGSETAELMVVTKTSGGWRISAVHWSSRRRRS